MGQRLLVLDADDKFIDEHRAALEFNFDVDFVDSPESVIKMLDDGDYGAILISLEIDENRGYAVCASIRNRTSLPGFKIAIISSKATESDFAKHSKLRVRADLYLSKPIAASALISAMGTLIHPKTSALDNTLDVLMGVDIGEEWLESLNRVEPLRANKSKRAPLPAGKPIKPVALSNNLECKIRELEYELQTKTNELLKLQQENQELHRQNAAITANFNGLEKWQKNTEELRYRLHEAEDQLKQLESASSLEDYANEFLRNRLKEVVAEKQALLQQLEALTQEIAEKNQHVVASLQARQDLHQQLLDVEGSKRRLELEFEDRVESERKLLMSRIDNFQDSGADIRKRIIELEDSFAAKTNELESVRIAHGKEKKRLSDDFERQKQSLTSLISTQQEKIRVALDAMDESRKTLAELLSSDLAVEGDS